jgi:hypothetical protein
MERIRKARARWQAAFRVRKERVFPGNLCLPDDMKADGSKPVFDCYRYDGSLVFIGQAIQQEEWDDNDGEEEDPDDQDDNAPHWSDSDDLPEEYLEYLIFKGER